MPDDHAGAIPNLETVEAGPALRKQQVGLRDRILVREAGHRRRQVRDMAGSHEKTMHKTRSRVEGVRNSLR